MIVNLAAREAVHGACVAKFRSSVLPQAGLETTEHLAHTRPFWLDVKNTVTNESQTFLLNYLARNIDHDPAATVQAWIEG